jgi:hypothetical protein
LAVAMAVSSGASGLEAAVVLGGDTDGEGVAAVREIAPEAAIHFADGSGEITSG